MRYRKTLRPILFFCLLMCHTMAAATGGERQPEFPGGERALLEFIQKNMRYPESAAEQLIQGRVTLSFAIEKDGSLTHIEVMRSPDDALSEEAIRIVKLMPKWKPGGYYGRKEPIRVKYVLPIRFNLGFDDVVIPARFPGGDEALANYLQYNRHFPPSVHKYWLSRDVRLKIFIEADGTVCDSVIVDSSLDDELSAEAIRMVKSMPRWTPEWRNGRPVRSWHWVRVYFDVMEFARCVVPDPFGMEIWTLLALEEAEMDCN